MASPRGVQRRGAARGSVCPCQHPGAGCCFVRAEGSQGDVETPLCPSDCADVGSCPESWAVSRHGPSVTQDTAGSLPVREGHDAPLKAHGSLEQGKIKLCSLFPPLFVATLILRPLPPPCSTSQPCHTCEQEVCILKPPGPYRGRSNPLSAGLPSQSNTSVPSTCRTEFAHQRPCPARGCSPKGWRAGTSSRQGL